MKKLTKKLVMLSLFGLSMGAVNAQTHPALGGGTGDSLSPYQITDTSHLRILADYVNNGNGDSTKGKYYVLLNDLDLSADTAGAGWMPIGNSSSYFKGNFNGNNKKVTNLKINRPTKNFQGLFGYIYGATVENLGIENCDIAGQGNVGGLAGCIDYFSTISNCYVTGNVNGKANYDGIGMYISGTGNRVGGLAGNNNNNSKINNCYSTVIVSGINDVGGLVGYNYYYSQINNSYATGKVSGQGIGTLNNCWVGGLVGVNGNSYIYDSYATGNVIGTGNYVGGLVGENGAVAMSLYNCYATGDVSGIGTYNNGTGTVGGLVGSNSGTFTNCHATGNVSGTGGTIGGLVGTSSGAIADCYATGKVSGLYYVGGFAGNNGYLISNCYATGDCYAYGYVSGAGAEPNATVGGFAGSNGSLISNCYATGNVSGTGKNVGGFVGYMYMSNISHCYATGNVRGTSNYVGGLVGCKLLASSSPYSYLILNCVAVNDSVVSTASTTSINRICGNSDGTALNNYAISTMVVQSSSGDVTITDDRNTYAGLSKSLADFQNLAFYTDTSNWNTNWNATAWSIDSLTAIWKICDGKSLPFLRWQGIKCNGESVVYTITATAGANGSITPAGAIDVEEGKDQTFTFTANSGYQIAQVFIDDTNNSAAVAAGTYTFTNVQANHKIEVYFSPSTGIVGAGHALPLPRIYPNPTNGQLRVSGDIWDSGDREIRISNVVGQVVFTSQLSKLSPETTIDISCLANGLYFLKVNGKVVKIVKE